jgi:hypothetical protein
MRIDVMTDRKTGEAYFQDETGRRVTQSEIDSLSGSVPAKNTAGILQLSQSEPSKPSPASIDARYIRLVADMKAAGWTLIGSPKKDALAISAFSLGISPRSAAAMTLAGIDIVNLAHKE